MCEPITEAERVKMKLLLDLDEVVVQVADIYGAMFQDESWWPEMVALYRAMNKTAATPIQEPEG